MSSELRLPEENEQPLKPFVSATAPLSEPTPPFVGVRMSTFIGSMLAVNFIWWFLVFGMSSHDFSNPDNGDRKHDHKKQAVVVEEGAYLVFVLENQTATDEQTLVMREAQNYVDRNGMKGWRRWDKDSEEAQQYVDYAAKIGIDPPFICLVTDSRITNARTFPTLKEFSPGVKEDGSVGGTDALPPNESQEAAK